MNLNFLSLSNLVLEATTVWFTQQGAKFTEPLTYDTYHTHTQVDTRNMYRNQ